jgi:hypothetical protein
MNNMMLLCVIVGIAAIAIVFLLFCGGKKEGYSNLGDVDNIGSVDDPAYSLVDAPEDTSPALNFARMDAAAHKQQGCGIPDVGCLGEPGDEQQLIRGTLDRVPPMKRLEQCQGSDLMPRISRDVTPYDIDIADPVSQLYSVNAPAVQLKNHQRDQADPYRGDIAIAYKPNLAVVGRTRFQSPEFQRNDGFFSDGYRSLTNKYTGKGYKNLPILIGNQETICDS